MPAATSEDEKAFWRIRPEERENYERNQTKFESQEFGDYRKVLCDGTGIAASPCGRYIGLAFLKDDGEVVKVSVEAAWASDLLLAQLMLAIERCVARGPSQGSA